MHATPCYHLYAYNRMVRKTNNYMTNLTAKLATSLSPRRRTVLPTRLLPGLIAVNSPPRVRCTPSEVQGRRLKEVRNCAFFKAVSHSLEPWLTKRFHMKGSARNINYFSYRNIYQRGTKKRADGVFMQNPESSEKMSPLSRLLCATQAIFHTF